MRDTPLVVGFAPELVSPAESGVGALGVLVSSPTDVRRQVGLDTLESPTEGSALADAALALLAQGFPVVRVVRAGDRSLPGVQKAEALRSTLASCVVSPEGWAGIVLAGAVWIEDGQDLLQVILDSLSALVLPHHMGPVVVPAMVNPSADDRMAQSFSLTSYWSSLMSIGPTGYVKFPYVPLAFAVASSDLSLWGAYCGSGSILQWSLATQALPPAVRPLPRAGLDAGFPYRLKIGAQVYHPIPDLATRGISVLDTGEDGAYRWAAVRVLTEPEGVAPASLLVLRSWIARVESLVETRLLGLPLTLERQQMFEREVREGLSQAIRAAHALNHDVRFEYSRSEVQVFVRVEFAYAVLSFPLRLRLIPSP